MRLLISLLLFFVLTSSYAQKKAMTEKEYLELQAKIRFNFNANIDSAIVYAHQMAKSGNYKHLAFANGALTCLLQSKGRPKEADAKYILAFKYLDKIPDSEDKTKLKAYIINYGGLAELYKGNFSKSLDRFQQGMKLSEEVGDLLQVFKFRLNLVLLNDQIGNSQLVIKEAKELMHFLDNNKELFSKKDFYARKSSIYSNLGSAYENWFLKDKNKTFLLDSSAYYLKRAILYSDDLAFFKATATLSLGNIYNWKHDFKNAEKHYKEAAKISAKSNLKDILCVSIYNLADIYYSKKNYNQALVFFKKSDSIAAITNLNKLDYLKSNFYQAQIYSILNQPELAYKHSQIYLKNYEEFESRLNAETAETNYKQGLGNLTDQMISIEKEYKKDLFWNKCLKAFYVFLFLLILFFLIKNIRDKRKAHAKMNALIAEFKAKLEKQNSSEPEIVCIEQTSFEQKAENNTISIDEDTENQIVKKLLDLERKKEFLNPEFSLPYAAKKIKTNTTYLSNVVNKRFGKSFGDYSNELKMNYVIREMISNRMYRKYSTQAIAESVGYKSANSFSKSFRKRTGVSPVQFAKNI